MATKTITITKLDQYAEKPTVSREQPVAGKKAPKTMRTFPKSILKTAKQHKTILKPVSDPARSPPLKKNMKHHTIRLITDKGSRRHRKTLKKQIAKMSNEKVRDLIMKNGLLKNPNTPPAIMREMLEGGAIAGFVSLI